MKCDFSYQGMQNDWHVYVCSQCGKAVRMRQQVKKLSAMCGIHGPPPFEETLRPGEKVNLENAAKESGMLLGDAIAALTTAIGIPPCGGCEKRKKWLNDAHAWLIGRTLPGQSTPPTMPPQ